MKCIECRWMYSNETMDGVHICVNGQSEFFGQIVDLGKDDGCPYGKAHYLLKSKLSKESKKEDE